MPFSYLPLMERQNSLQCEELEHHGVPAKIDPRNLANLPYYAKWKETVICSSVRKPRVGQCTAYSEENSLLYIAFGSTTNNILLNDLIAFDPVTYKFKTIMNAVATPRTNASSVLDGNYLYIFGGNDGEHDLNDFLRINIKEKKVEKICCDDPAVPSPRNSAVIASLNHRIYIWGGNSGFKVDNDIHVYDPSMKRWAKIPTDVDSLFSPGYTQIGQYCYIFGSSADSNLLRMDLERFTIEELHPTGSGPQSTVNRPALIGHGNFLFCFGGTSQYLYSHLFCYDISKNWWFVFHIKPSMDSIEKGEITNLGLFKIPREHSQSVILVPSQRKIIYFHGNRLENDVPIYELKIGKAIAEIHAKSDILKMLQL